MIYTDKLKRAVKAANSTLCVGLDPNPDLIPAPIQNKFSSPEEQVLTFCKLVIDYTSEFCAAYKPNPAFFESLGKYAFEVLEEIIRHIPDDKIIIADAKRGDISSTSSHYKKAFFDVLNADAITLNPLLGFETLDAFTNDETKAVYVLTLTSNSGAADFLKKPFEGYDMMSCYIASQLSSLSENASAHIGMVIGATNGDEISKVISHYPESSLLIPGIGAQGGSIQQLSSVLQHHPGIPLINSSRGIIYAGINEENWPELIAQKAKQVKEELKAITGLYV